MCTVQWWAVLFRFNKSLFPTFCVDTHIFLDVIKAGCSEMLSDPYVFKQAKDSVLFWAFRPWWYSINFPGSDHSARRMLGLKLLPLLLCLLPWSMVSSLPAKCEKREFAETQTKYQQCAAAKIDSISKALEVRDCKVYLAHDHLDNWCLSFTKFQLLQTSFN